MSLTSPIPFGHAARLRVRAIQHASRFFHRAEKTKCARDETDIVVDRLRHADDGESVAAFARLLVEIVRAALRAVSTDGEENVHVARNEIIDCTADIHRSARRAEDSAALMMNAIDELRRDRHWFHSRTRDRARCSRHESRAPPRRHSSSAIRGRASE